MDTTKTAKRTKEQQLYRAAVRWPVTVLTPHGRIEGETQSISASSLVISCTKIPPMESSFRVLIRVPDHAPVDATVRSVWTGFAPLEDGTVRLGTELRFAAISKSDRRFLQNVISSHYQEKIRRSTSTAAGGHRLPAATEAEVHSRPETSRVELEVSYNRAGKTVVARGTNFSTRGCHVYSKTPAPAAPVFSLKISDPRTSDSMQFDCAVVQCRYSAATDQWGMVLRFMRVGQADREQMRRLLEESASPAKQTEGPRYSGTRLAQSISKYFKLKRLLQ